MKVRGVLQTPDGRHRVEVVQRGTRVFYRLTRDGEVSAGLAIATVVRLLAEAGVDMADLVDDSETPVTDNVGQGG